jgi:hypothetical protein
MVHVPQIPPNPEHFPERAADVDPAAATVAVLNP